MSREPPSCSESTEADPRGIRAAIFESDRCRQTGFLGDIEGIELRGEQWNNSTSADGRACVRVAWAIWRRFIYCEESGAIPRTREECRRLKQRN